MARPTDGHRYEGIQRVLQSEGANMRNVVQPLRDGVLIRDGSQPSPDKQYRIAALGGAASEGLREANPVRRSTDAAKKGR